ncbi:MAG: RNB domain-containing ribonuclease [Proteobacteria bacterium]|nr:RNB domain-containing ribonuclease [Pseudomonadota bacterium]
MNVLFEDDGQLKAGAILADNDASLQVEAASGKRLKVKSANVLLRYASPSPGETLAEAERIRPELDATFLWEVSGDGDFGFDALARDYFGAAPSAPQQLAVAQLLQSSPMHFYKKGRGHYRKAPETSLRAALASVERKAQEAARVEAWADELAAGRWPEALAARREMLLYHPDKQSLEWKALAQAAERTKTNTLALMARVGAIPSTHDYHFAAFRLQAFPRGLAFPAWGALPALPELPRADVTAFSIDDASTTEIDDAFSVRALPDGGAEIGIHIAAPALAIARGTPLDAIARERLSTVYMPGRKITMLPEPVIDAFTLAEGADRPALSLYVDTAPDGTPRAHRTVIERVPVVANLRLDAIPETFADPAAPDDAYAWTPALRTLWRVVEKLGAARGRNDPARVDFNFAVDWTEPDGRVTITTRPRGAPLDKLVSELMIHVNATWGKLLADAKVAGLYRVQSGGKVKMSARPGEHQGLGLTHYLWSSSPLRRFSDLVNQQQLLAAVAGDKPPYADNDADLFAALADFEATYSQYAEFQDRMEHYWSLRWLLQEQVGETTAVVVRDNLVRFERIPLWQRLPDLPTLPADSRVRVAVDRIDLVAATLECRYAGPLDGDAVMTAA